MSVTFKPLRVKSVTIGCKSQRLHNLQCSVQIQDVVKSIIHFVLGTGLLRFESKVPAIA